MNLVEGEVHGFFRTGQIVLEIEVIKSRFPAIFRGIDFWSQGPAVGAARAAVSFKIANHIGVAGLHNLGRNVATPTAFGIPEAPGAEAQQTFIHFIGKSDGPKTVGLRKVRQHGMGIGRTHELALASRYRRLQFFQHIRRFLRHVLQRVPRGLKDKWHVWKLRLHGIQRHLICPANNKFIAIFGQVSVI